MASRGRNQLANNVNTFLILTGLYPKLTTNIPLINKMYKVYAVFIKTIYNWFYWGIFAELIRIIAQGYPLEIILPSVSIVITATKVSIQIFMYFKNNVIKVIEEISKLEQKIWEENDSTIIKLYLSKIATARLFRAMITFWTFLTVAAFIVTGSIANIKIKQYNDAHNASIETHYLYMFWFPANKLDYFKLILTINIFFGYSAVIYNTATHLITLVLCVSTSTQLAILQHRLRTYIPDDLTEEQNPKAISMLKQLIKEHQYIIKFHQNVNKSIQSIIMINFVLTSFDVATGAIQMLKIDQQSNLDSWIIVYTFLVVITIFCLAWSTNEVFVQSSTLGSAAYTGNWYLLNKEGRQLTHILIHQSQRPLLMTIGPFGPMTLESFVMIMKLAYSYVTVMRE